MKVEQNIKRLKYLLSLFSMTIDDLLILISEGLKNPILEEEILSDNIKLSHLKRIDKVFKLYFSGQRIFLLQMRLKFLQFHTQLMQ